MRIFISYRRADAPDAVARIYGHLKDRLRNAVILYDHKSLELGTDFPAELREQVTSADTVLVIIGPEWVRLLHERKAAAIDHVREEVKLALETGGQVIPLLVNSARMPNEADFMDFPDLLLLLKKNAQPILPEPDFEYGCGKLLDHLERTGFADVLGSMLAGKYKVQSLISDKGGMGDVYLAEQTQPIKRLVAIKLVKAGMDTKEILGRFEAERQALAVMNHPNVCKVLDAGAAPNGRPFFAMEYVKGIPITQYCDERKLTTKERLELFMTVCQALQHAHQKGIIHRDLKPGNVLVETVDGKPVPKVIDFGLAKALGAKLTDRSFVATELGKWVGTLEYSSPEQAEGRFDIDTLTDVYSLGVLLYELLAGSPPFTRAELMKGGEAEMRRMIREQEPSKPSTKLSSSANLPVIAANRQLDPTKLTKSVRGDLDWIVMKALEKETGRRYATPTAFGEDLRHYLNSEPITAGKPNAGYRLRKFVRRNRGSAFTVAAVIVALATGGGIAAWQAYVANKSADNERIAKEAANQSADNERKSKERAKDAANRTNQFSEFLLHSLADADPWNKYLPILSKAGGRDGVIGRELNCSPEFLLNLNNHVQLDLDDYPNERIRIQLLLASALRSLARYEDAESILRDVETLQAGSAETPGVDHWRLKYGFACLHQERGEIGGALDEMKMLLTGIPQSIDRLEIANARFRCAWMFSDRSSIELIPQSLRDDYRQKALEELSHARAEYQSVGVKKLSEQIIACDILGLMISRQGGMEGIITAMSIINRMPNKDFLASVLTLAMGYELDRNNGKYRQALEKLKELHALILKALGNNSFYEALVLGAISGIEKNCADVESDIAKKSSIMNDAEQHIADALVIAERFAPHHPRLIEVYLKVASHHLERGNIAEARKLIAKAERIPPYHPVDLKAAPGKIGELKARIPQ